MVLGHYRQIAQIRIRVVFHKMRMAFRAIVHLTFGNGLNLAVVIKRRGSAYDINYLTVAIMPVKAA